MVDKNKTEKITDYIEMGKFYFLNSKYSEAIKEYKNALKIDPNNSEICYNLGLAYESNNQQDLAVKMYQRTLEIDPNHQLAKKHLDKILGL